MRKNLWGVRFNYPDTLISLGYLQTLYIYIFFSNRIHCYKAYEGAKTPLSLCCPSFCFLENAELDALEADMDFESESVPSYLQPDQEPELSLPAAPTGHAAVPANQQQVVKLL
jgi:hypothetical protein